MSENLKQKRVWWLVVLLLVLVNVASWQRPLIGRWLAKTAIRKAGNDDPSAQRFIQYAMIAWRQTPEAVLASARIARRNNKSEDFSKEMQRAKFLGLDNDLYEREQILSLAQNGRMSIVGDKLAGLVESPGEDETQICEAYALGYMRHREFSKALSLLHAWATDHPKDARPWTWMGKIYAELKSNDAAETAFKKALDRNLKHPIAAQGLGSLLVELKRVEESLKYFPLALEDSKVGPDAAVGLANALRSLSKLDESKQVLSDALKIFPDDYRVRVSMAEALIEEGSYQRAVDLLRTLIDEGTTRREIRYTYAIALRGIQQIDEAAKHFEYAAEATKKTNEANLLIPQAAEEKTNYDVRYRIGEANLRWGNIEDGQMWLQSVLELNPNHGPTHLALAEFYRQQAATNPRHILLAQKHAALARKAGVVAIPPEKPPTKP
jgi:Tfp pilus assembly protein PilF